MSVFMMIKSMEENRQRRNTAGKKDAKMILANTYHHKMKVRYRERNIRIFIGRINGNQLYYGARQCNDAHLSYLYQTERVRAA